MRTVVRQARNGRWRWKLVTRHHAGAEVSLSQFGPGHATEAKCRGDVEFWLRTIRDSGIMGQKLNDMTLRNKRMHEDALEAIGRRDQTISRLRTALVISVVAAGVLAWAFVSHLMGAG